MNDRHPPEVETPANPAERPEANGQGRGGFAEFLRGVPVVYGLLGAAITAVINLLVVTRLLPGPLERLDVFTSILILVALLVGWAGRHSIRRHLGKVITLTAFAVVLLIMASAFLVCEVQYSMGGQTVEQSYLTGWSYADLDLQGLSCAEAIRMVGNSRDDLRVIWGSSFDIALAGYTLLYLAILFGVVVSLASLQAVPASGRK